MDPLEDEEVRDLPTGTVTFLFTDVEGSTRLLQRLGDGYGDVQRRYYALVRAAISDGGGREVSTEGDSFFAVFPTPRGAVHAAVRAQRELIATRWPDEIQLRVRVGLHTGEGSLGADNYLGLDVNRAARIAAAAHGGQILISDAARALVERDLPSGTRLRDVGRHALKDLAHPEHLHQLVVEGLEQDFPAPKTLDARPNNLPAQLTRFIGRHDEVTRIRELLAENRLVTLTGIGGTGKTRLALRVAAEALDDFDDGVFFVDLSSMDDPDLVPTSVAAALNVREESGRPTIDTVVDHLRGKNLLLVLDNFEQLVETGSTLLEPLLREVWDVGILVTSRVPLRLYGEQQFPVPPLALPDPRRLPALEELACFEAIALFAERAAAAKPDFRVTEENAAAVAEITARLDGLPLAIELVAGRIKLLAPEGLLSRLEHRLPLLTAGDRNVPERHRTLRGVIEWSHDLLSAAERQMLARFAVFAGGVDIEAADAVANPHSELELDTLDVLASLVEKSLLRTLDGPNRETRFGMLETIREFALERLSISGEESAMRRRHAAHWINVAERASEALAGPEQAEWAQRLEQDHDNFRAALSWTSRSGEAQLGLRLAALLEPFWRLGSHVREGLRWLDELLMMPEAAEQTLLRARALTAAADLHAWIDDPGANLLLAGEALAIFRSVGEPAEIANSLGKLGWAHLQAGDLDSAKVSLAEAKVLNARLGNREQAANCSNGLAIVAQFEGQNEEARRLFEEALEVMKEVENTYWVGLIYLMISQADKAEGRFDAADDRILAGLTIFRELDNVMGMAWALYSLGDVALQRGEPERALRLIGACDAHLQGGEMPALAKATMGDVGAAARGRLDPVTAEGAYAEGLAMALEDAEKYAFQ